MTNETPPVVNYDRQADVLYVAYESMGAITATEKDGVLRRYGPDRQLIGITIMDFGDWLCGVVGEEARSAESRSGQSPGR